MFYLKEIFLRIFYFLFSFLIVFILFYFYKNDIFLFLSLLLIKNLIIENVIEIQHTLTFTTPSELFEIYFLVTFYCSLIFLLPLLIYHVFDFNKSILNNKKINILFLLIKNTFIFYYSLFLIFCYIFIPLVWIYFEKYNEIIKQTFLINLHYQLKIDSYLNFLNYIFYFLIFLTLICYVLIYIGSFLSLKNFIFLKFFLYIFIFLILQINVIIFFEFLTFLFLTYYLLKYTRTYEYY